MRAWCTEWTKCSNKKRALFSMTLEGIHIGIRFDCLMNKVFISPMSCEDWLVIRNAINKYLKKEGLE